MILMGIIPVSCEMFCKDSCGCSPMAPVRDFQIKAMYLQTVSLDNQEYVEDKYYEPNILVKALRVEEFDYVSEATYHFNGNWFTSVAMACDPVPPQSVQYVESVTIIAEKDFYYIDHSIEAGTDISDLFLINGGHLHFLATMKKTLFLGEHLFIRLKESPFQPTTVQFSLEVVLSDQSVHKFENEVLKVR